jgi:alanyl-tRNA synthetase
MWREEGIWKGVRRIEANNEDDALRKVMRAVDDTLKEVKDGFDYGYNDLHIKVDWKKFPRLEEIP